MSANNLINKPLKIATAFSGGLAAVEFALKYEELNHEIVFACEWDKFARQQYLKFHGEPKTFYNDISDLNANKYLNEIDLFVWGSPCQDLSLAGKRKGFDGEKSSLFREGARVQKEMMPKNFIFENVKGLLSSNKGADYKEVCETFREMGYHIATLQMNTKDFGVPQNRERVFIVGFLNADEYHNYKEPIKFELKTRLKDVLEDEVDDKYFLSQKQYQSIINPKYESMGIDRVNSENDVCNCLTTMGGGNREPKVFINSATKKGYEIATDEDSINFTHPDSKTRRGRVGKGVAQTLDCACNQGVIEKSNIRKLTPRECFRLQAVKDKDINLVVSDSQAYKIAGNAISVNVMQELLKSLYKKEKSNLSIFDFMGEIA